MARIRPEAPAVGDLGSRPAGFRPGADDVFADPDDFRAAMRQLAGGITIVTTGMGKGRCGLTATAVCSLSAEPPMLLVCVNRSTESRAAILRHGAFCVNLAAAEHQVLAERFAGRVGVRGAEKFATGCWDTLATGSPVLSDALAAFDCAVLDWSERASHTIFIGGVRAVRTAPHRPALIYRSGQFAILP